MTSSIRWRVRWPRLCQDRQRTRGGLSALTVVLCRNEICLFLSRRRTPLKLTQAHQHGYFGAILFRLSGQSSSPSRQFTQAHQHQCFEAILFRLSGRSSFPSRQCTQAHHHKCLEAILFRLNGRSSFHSRKPKESPCHVFRWTGSPAGGLRESVEHEGILLHVRLGAKSGSTVHFGERKDLMGDEFWRRRPDQVTWPEQVSDTSMSSTWLPSPHGASLVFTLRVFQLADSVIAWSSGSCGGEEAA